jgi:hypothetical protein
MELSIIMTPKRDNFTIQKHENTKMLKYICKPSLFNNKGMKTFITAEGALEYLNEKLSSKVDDENYVYIAPSMAKKDVQDSLEDYQFMGKLTIEWDLN